MKNGKLIKRNWYQKQCVLFFDDMINGTDISFSDILLHQKLYESISVYGISYKTSKTIAY